MQKRRDFEEFGVKPLSQSEKGKKKKKERWDEALKAAKEGRFEDIPSDIRLRYHSSIKNKERTVLRSLRYSMSWIMNGGMDLPVPVSPEPPMSYPDAYIKKANTKWWDGYIDQRW